MRGGLRFQKPPIDITSSQTDVSNVVKLVNLRDDDYVLDDGIYKRVWNVIFHTYNDQSYQYQVVDGHTADNIPNTSRTGYTFRKWSSHADWNPNSEITNDMYLFAEYDRTTFTISVDANGGNGSYETTAEYGDVISQPQTVRDGNTLVGWFYSVNCGNHVAGEQVTFPFTIDSDIYIRAEWNVNVTFISSGDVYMNETIRSGTSISSPSDPVKNGYTFDYWMLDNSIFDFSTNINQNITLIAHYTIINYTITYHLNDGNNNSNNRTSYNVETNTFTIYAATRYGYTFNGWSGTGLSSNTTSFTIAKGSTGDREYTANWTMITYNIGYSTSYYTIENHTEPQPMNATTIPVNVKIKRSNSYVTSGIRAYIKGVRLAYSNGYWTGNVTVKKLTNNISLYIVITNRTVTKADFEATDAASDWTHCYFSESLSRFNKQSRRSLTFSDCVFETGENSFYAVYVNSISFTHSMVLTSAKQMFAANHNGYLTSLDVSGLDVSGISIFELMFSQCEYINTLDVSNFDTSNATTMKSMFSSCYCLQSLDLSSFDTSNVTDMNGMFRGCKVLKSLDLSSFDTSNVTDMSYMFGSLNEATSINVSSFNTSKVKSMDYMFEACKKLTSINVSSFNTSSVTQMGCMFNNCESLTSLNLRYFNTSNVEYMTLMFYECKALASLNISNFDTSNVKGMQSMFSECKALASINVSSFSLDKCIDIMGLFAGCSSLTTIDISNFDTHNVCADRIFEGTTSLRTLILGPDCDYGALNYKVRLKSRDNSEGYYDTGKTYSSKSGYTYTLVV